MPELPILPLLQKIIILWRKEEEQLLLNFVKFKGKVTLHDLLENLSARNALKLNE